MKAAGGIRDYETLCKMHDMGVSRFGVSLSSGIKIVEEARSKPYFFYIKNQMIPFIIFWQKFLS